MKPWEKYQQSSGPWDKYKNQPREENNSFDFGSAKTGAFDSASFGLIDELAGALEAGGQAVGLKNLGSKDLTEIDTQTPVGFDLDKLQDIYTQARDKRRSDTSSALEKSPGSYLTGGVVGGLAMPGGSAKTLPGKIAQGATTGAIAGFGMSNADNAQDIAKDVAFGLGVGAAMPVAVKGAGMALGKASDALSDAADWTVKKTGKGLFGVDEKATEHYLKNRDAVNKAYSLGELADSVLNQTDDSSALNEMRKRSSELSSQAWNTLNEKGSIKKSDILRAIQDGQDSLMIDGSLVGKVQERAYNTLGGLSDQIGSLSDDISEPQLKKIIQHLDTNINWNNPELGPSNDAVRSLRTFIDQSLKNQNQGYKKAMGAVEEVTKAQEQVKSVFQNRLNPENYDKFNKQVKNLVNKDDLSAANKAVNNIQKHTGYDLRSDILDSWTSSQFEKGDTNGSRKTLMGSVIGGAAGSALGPAGGGIGAAVGAGIGYTADRYAGPIFKSLLNGKLNASETIQRLSPQMGKYAKPLLDAAQRGNHSLSATHFLFMQQDPEYRKMIQTIDGE